MTILNLYKTLGDRVEVSLKDGLTPEERETESFRRKCEGMNKTPTRNKPDRRVKRMKP